MRLSLYSSVSFKNPFGLEHAIAIAGSLGYEAIDVRGYSLDVPIVEQRHMNALGYDMIGPDRLDDSGIEMLKKRLEETSLVISGISCYNSLTLPEGELADISFEKFREMIDFAASMNIPGVRLIGYSEEPFNNIKQSRTAAKKLFASRIRKLCDYGAGKKVSILLENGENSIPNNSAEMLEIANEVNHDNLLIVFDVFNMVFEGLDPLEELKKLGDRVSILHVKNATLGKAGDDEYNPKAGTGFMWSYLTEGMVDYKEIMDRLLEQGFNGDIVCEYANPYKGMDRDFWNSIPDAYSWADNAKKFLDAYVKK